MSPPTTHTAKKLPMSATLPATIGGERKMPAPTMRPTTSTTPSKVDRTRRGADMVAWSGARITASDLLPVACLSYRRDPNHIVSASPSSRSSAPNRLRRVSVLRVPPEQRANRDHDGEQDPLDGRG